MSDILMRAYAELTATTTRLASYEEQIAKLNSDRDLDILRQAELETYITKHEALAADAAKLIADILPPVPAAAPPPPPAKPAPKARVKGGRRGRPPATDGNPKLAFGIIELRAKVFPVMRDAGVVEFDMKDLLAAIDKAKLPGPAPIYRQIQVWLGYEHKQPQSVFELGSIRGRYKFKASFLEAALVGAASA